MLRSRWLAGLDAPRLTGTWQALAFLGSLWVLNILGFGLVLALLALRRFRHLILALIVAQLLTTISEDVMGSYARRPRPFGVAIGASWGGWALPSLPVMHLAATLVVVLYTLVPEVLAAGGWGGGREVVALAGLGHGAGGRGPDRRAGRGGHRRRHPARLVPPVRPQRGLPDQLPTGPGRSSRRRRRPGGRGRRMEFEKLNPVAGGGAVRDLRAGRPATPAGSCRGTASATWLAVRPSARNHLRADRWYKLGRELLYSRLEDEKPFNTVRRLVQQEDYALQVCRDAGLPTPGPYGVVGLTPERKYLLSTRVLHAAPPSWARPRLTRA